MTIHYTLYRPAKLPLVKHKKVKHLDEFWDFVRLKGEVVIESIKE